MSETKKKLKKLPVLLSDEEAERFVDEADLSEYDLSVFKPVKFELRKKDARVEARIPQSQLTALKELARDQDVPYSVLIRQFIEQGIETMKSESA